MGHLSQRSNLVRRQNLRPALLPPALRSIWIDARPNPIAPASRSVPIIVWHSREKDSPKDSKRAGLETANPMGVGPYRNTLSRQLHCLAARRSQRPHIHIFGKTRSFFLASRLFRIGCHASRSPPLDL